MAKKLPKNITLRSDGRYMGRFTYRGDTYTLYGSNPNKLKKELDNLRYEVEHALYVKQSSMTFGEWFNTWLEDYKRNSVKQGTYQTYKQAYVNMVSDTFSKMKLSEIRPDTIQKYLNKIYASHYSDSRLKLAYVLLREPLEQAMKNNMIINNPAYNVNLPGKKTKKKEKSVVALSKEEQHLFLEYADSSVYYPIYEFALSTGMRIGEILALQWSDIDFEEKEIHVSGTLIYVREESRRYKDTPKSTSGDRIIPMLNNVILLLKKQKSKQLQQKLLLGEKYGMNKCIDDLVFTGDLGDAIWDSAIRVDMRKIIKRIKESHSFPEDISLHIFRHTFATRGLENGIDMKTMQTILGHSSLSMTMDLYSHVLPDKKHNEMSKLEGII